MWSHQDGFFNSSITYSALRLFSERKISLLTWLTQAERSKLESIQLQSSNNLVLFTLIHKMDLASQKGVAEVLEDVERCLLPIFISVKTKQVQHNKHYIQQSRQSSTSTQDEQQAQKTFLNFVSRPKYPRSLPADIIYPHNVYSIYCPVMEEMELDDEYVRTFPLLRKFKEEFKSNQRGVFYNIICEGLKKTPWMNSKESWRVLLNSWIWDADLEEVMKYYELLIRGGEKALRYIHEVPRKVKSRVVEQQIEQISKHLHSKSTLRKYLQFSVEKKEEINEVSIVKTAKQLLCGSCLIYDCPRHKLEDAIIEENNQFVHPRNKPTTQSQLQGANLLLNFYYQCCQETSVEEEMEEMVFCSETCYKHLRKYSFGELRHHLSAMLSPSIKALIKLGIQMLGYSPCHIALIAQARITCSMVFWYLIEFEDIETQIHYNFESPLAYLMSIAPAGEEPPKQLQRKRKPKKKKDVAVSSDPEAHNASTITPLCYHHFLHKENNQEEQGNTCQNCACAARKFCLPSCLCDQKCKLRIKGCFGCKDCSSSQCPCYRNERECDPDICKGCFPTHESRDHNWKGKLITCINNQHQLQRYPKLKLGLSTLPEGGLGLFSGEFIPQHSIISSYSGELIDNCLQSLRQAIADDLYFYNFGFNDSSIDAKYFGNKSRFINHDNGKVENCYSKIKYAKSDYFLAMYALRDIKKNEELFFDYDGRGILFKDYREKYPFIKKRQLKP